MGTRDQEVEGRQVLHSAPVLTYEQKHQRLVAYLIVKVEEADWHGVSDAANDLRVLEAEKRGTMA